MSTPKTLTVSIENHSGQPGTNVYLMLVGSGSSDGQIQPNVPITLDKISNSSFTIASGMGLARIYISFEASVSVGEPFDSQTRFDWVELTYATSGVSQINLTAVDQFGIPLAIQAFGKDAGHRSWVQSANEIISGLSSLAPNAVIKKLSSNGEKEFVRVKSPQQANTAYSTPDWNGYLDALKGAHVQISDVFSQAGAAPIHIDYTGQFAADHTLKLSGSLTQNGKRLATNYDLTISGPKPPSPPPNVPDYSFAEQIYQANGPYFRSDTSGTYHTAGENNEYSVIYRDVISGLQNGFIGGKYGNSTKDWVGRAAFAQARSTPDGFYNHYAALIEEYSAGNVYGYAFSDYSSHPLLTFSDSNQLQISILSDSQVFSPA